MVSFIGVGSAKRYYKQRHKTLSHLCVASLTVTFVCYQPHCHICELPASLSHLCVTSLTVQFVCYQPPLAIARRYCVHVSSYCLSFVVSIYITHFNSTFKLIRTAHCALPTVRSAM
jgi:hypothetical protein